MNLIKYNSLLTFCENILSKIGLDDFSMKSVSKGLCESSLRGVDSHGIRLLPHYVESAIKGRKNPRPKFKLNLSFATCGVLDADNGFGHAAGFKAIEHCIKIAEKMGLGSVAVKNSSHPGSLASMALNAARKGYICFAFTHADSLMKSHNGERAFFGTNPICFAAPRTEKEPYCLDMATSMISWNKLLQYRDNKESMPKDLAADQNGNMTINPSEAVSLLPAGEYKGYGLASMVEILCGVLTGMAYGTNIPSMFDSPIDKHRKLGQFYIVLRTDICISKEKFSNKMQEMTNLVRNEPGLNNKRVKMPGDPEIDTAKKRMSDGIPLDNSTYISLRKLSEKYNIPLNLTMNNNS